MHDLNHNKAVEQEAWQDYQKGLNSISILRILLSSFFSLLSLSSNSSSIATILTFSCSFSYSAMFSFSDRLMLFLVSRKMSWVEAPDSPNADFPNAAFPNTDFPNSDFLKSELEDFPKLDRLLDVSRMFSWKVFGLFLNY